MWHDLHDSKDFIDYLREKITKKLTKVRISQYFDEMAVTTLDLVRTKIFGNIDLNDLTFIPFQRNKFFTGPQIAPGAKRLPALAGRTGTLGGS